MATADARARLQRVLGPAGLRDAGDAVLLPSDSNDTWLIGDRVLRVCWLGRMDRLLIEAELAAQLPAEVRYPPLLAAGGDEELAWTVTRRVLGRTGTAVWPGLDPAGRRRLVGQIADALQALHDWSPPASVHARLLAHAAATATAATELVGMDIVPLPVGRALALAGHAADMPHMPAADIARVHERLLALASRDPLLDSHLVVTHSDLHLGNVLCDGSRLTAVLDLEWTRLGPRDLDLEPFLRSVDWADTGDADLLSRTEMRRVLGWLAADYPRLFAHPDLVDRLSLYQLASTVRELFTWSGADLRPGHPVRRLPLFSSNQAHLRELLSDVSR